MSSPSRTPSLEPDDIELLELVHQLDPLRRQLVVQFAHDLTLIREERDSLACELEVTNRKLQ